MSYVGCGRSGPATAPVGGKVTFAGKPVAEGSVKFWSEADGTLAVGQIDSDGNYRLTTHPNLDGATLGKHRVTIRSVQTIVNPKAANWRDREKLVWLVPPRYDGRQSSPLTAEVTADSNTIDFNLPAESLPQ